jgi:hypothetical protein
MSVQARGREGEGWAPPGVSAAEHLLGTGAYDPTRLAAEKAALYAAPLTTCGAPRNLANVVSVGLSFLLVFTAFQTVQVGFGRTITLHYRSSTLHQIH